MTPKQLTLLLITLIVLGLVAVAGRALITPRSAALPTPTPSISTPVMCTMEAKLCPDGSYVGRVGPNCDFSMCPNTGAATTTATTTFMVSIGQRTGDFGIVISPTSVLEDSRCPLGVMCIQAGTVRLQAEVSAEGSTTPKVFVFNQPLVIGSRTVTLIGIEPIRRRDVTLAPSDYKFTFEVKK